MGISLAKLLNDYFGVNELKDALYDIGELTTGTKIELIKRLMAEWEPHRRNVYELLDYLDEEMLSLFCEDYRIDSDGNPSTLIRRIKKAGLLETNIKKSDFKPDPIVKNENKSAEKPTKSFFSIRNILIILGATATVTTILVNLTNIVAFISKH